MASLAPQLRKAALRFEEVETQLAQPETYADPDLVAKLNREQKDLAPLVEAWQQYEKVQQDLAGLEELLEDPEYRPLAQAEQAQAQQELARLEATLRTLLRPKDPMEGKNVFLEIRAGVGGRRPPSSPPTSTGCTPCTGRSRDGSGRWSPPTRPSWEGSRSSPA